MLSLEVCEECTGARHGPMFPTFTATFPSSMFGGGEEAAEASVGDVEQWRNMWGARVKWPVEMPDDILKHAIGECRRCRGVQRPLWGPIDVSVV